MNLAESTTAPDRPSPATLAKLLSTSSMSNRRSSSRRPPRGNVTIEVRKGNHGLGTNVAVLFLDLSEGGIRLVVNEEFDRHQEVEVHISAYGLKKPVKSIGAVRWVMPLDNGLFCIGIQFEKRLPYRDVTTLFKP
ncbi:MAG TPA: PilZ domain-containing protein [Gemmataceae bacterium]|jgi:hypothetical protein|nr:PilZ domain-containing protein [Gemmataceae bacterium]